MATTYPEALRVSDRPTAIRLSFPPASPRAEVAARILAPFTEASTPFERLHALMVVGSIAATIGVGLIAWPELATIGNAVFHLVP